MLQHHHHLFVLRGNMAAVSKTSTRSTHFAAVKALTGGELGYMLTKWVVALDKHRDLWG